MCGQMKITEVDTWNPTQDLMIARPTMYLTTKENIGLANQKMCYFQIYKTLDKKQNICDNGRCI